MMPNKKEKFTSFRLLKRASGFFGVMLIIGTIICFIIISVIIDLVDTGLTVTSDLKNNLNHIRADYISESVMNLVRNDLAKLDHEAGFNSGKIICRYGSFYQGKESENSQFCTDKKKWLDLIANGLDVSMEIEVKGRAEEKEKLKSANCGSSGSGKINDKCYVVPFPGTGDAGERCNRYQPAFIGDVLGQTMVSQSVTEVEYAVDQVDYSCNWNRLNFGGASERLAIPLYYDNGQGKIVNPFNKDESLLNKASMFFLRLRTPCLPCVDKKNYQADVNRVCEPSQDETVCKPGERYRLDADDFPDKTKEDDQLVVQWNLNGLCKNEKGKEEPCGLVAKADVLEPNSPIFEYYINQHNPEFRTKWQSIFPNFILLHNKSYGYDINSYPLELKSFVEKNDKDNQEHKILSPLLPSMTKVLFSMYMSDSLISDKKWNVPYLEYQLLTDAPVSDHQTRITVKVIVADIAYVRVVNLPHKTPLIDFAVQN